MNFVATTRLTLKKPKWVLAHLVETTQAATDNVLKGYDRAKKPKKDHDKKLGTELIPSTRNEHSFSSVSAPAKVQRDIFGATILPSNLSFDNMKKLSMNQIKLEEIPLVDENNVAEILAAEKSKAKEAAGKSTGSPDARRNTENDINLDLLIESPRREGRVLDFSKTDPFDVIPGPRFLESVASVMSHTARHVTAYFLLRLLRNGLYEPFRKYGPIVRLPRVMGGRILLVNRAEHISSIYEQDGRSPISSSLDALECSRLRRHGKQKKSCIPSAGDWEEMRKAVDEVLLRDEEKYFDGLEENGNNLVRRIREVKNRENEVPENFVKDINKWSLECLFQILFDKTLGFLDEDTVQVPSKNAQMLEAIQEATRNLAVCDGGLQMWRFMSTGAATSLDSYCHIIETILSEHVYQAQVDLLNKDDGPKTDPLTFTEGMLLLDGMTKADVTTHLLEILIIGMNATTSALTFLLYHLAKNPREQNELLREIKEILPEKYSRLEYEHLSSLKYLQACLKESLRLKMPMPVLTKYLKKDVILSNFQVPRGTLVLMAAQLEALKEENFEGALEFQPERWLDPESKNSSSFPSLPLSAYSQHSFETRLAEMAVVACVAQIIRNFLVEFNHGHLDASNATISYPVTPLRFGFFERED